MPFESDKQRRFMYAKHPKIAARWTREAKAASKAVTKKKKTTKKRGR